MSATHDVIVLGRGVVVGYRRGTNTQYTNQVLIRVVDTVMKRVDNLIGARVLVKDQWGNPYVGKVVRVHARGRNGVVIARFNRNVPGQVIGEPVQIYVPR